MSIDYDGLEKLIMESVAKRTKEELLLMINEEKLKEQTQRFGCDATPCPFSCDATPSYNLTEWYDSKIFANMQKENR